MEHAKVNDVELQYEVVGSGEPMLLIHGAHIADALQPLVAEPTPGAARCSSRATSSCMPGSRPARTPTSSARPTCSRCRRRRRWRQRSPPSCDGAVCPPPGRKAASDAERVLQVISERSTPPHA
jgi:hypothetical protein